jgi:1-acyl-sn-glycerol-3-phosphate acyltransferase
MVIFPQSTRSSTLIPEHFNSMGIKLARKGNVPVIPIALRTDAWGLNGLFGLLKDHGPIVPSLPVHFAFGIPLPIRGNGKQEHESVLAFIMEKLKEWEQGYPPIM